MLQEDDNLLSAPLVTKGCINQHLLSI